MLFLVSTNCFLFCSTDPTDVFINVPLTEDNFEIQRPYDVPLENRYSRENGIHRLWVYAGDKPYDPNSHTQPRTEVRMCGLDYSSGVWQFEGHPFVPKGTSDATILQIHGASHGVTTIILRIYDGDMRYYNGQVIATDLYDKWFRVNHVTVFLEEAQVFATKDQGPGDLYFKCGVYAAPANISYYMESRWRDIKISNIQEEKSEY